jgi:hypothetical protein
MAQAHRLLCEALLSKHEGTETMAEKKAAGKQTPTPLSLASRMLGASVRGKSVESPLDEPWRNKNTKRKSAGNRRK